MGRRKRHIPPPGQLSLDLFPQSQGQTVISESKSYRTTKTKTRMIAKDTTTKYNRSFQSVNDSLSTANMSQANQIIIPVETTFDPCQGIREAKQKCRTNAIPYGVVFDCRHLELASDYSTKNTSESLYAPEEQYLIGRGGLINNAVFVNLLRCYGTLAQWSKNEEKEGNIKPIKNFHFLAPSPQTSVGQLWNVLGMPDLTKPKPKNIWTASDVIEFQSRIVTPFLMVNDNNRNNILEILEDWLHFILNRIGNQTYINLLRLVSEVIKNLVEHGNQGVFGVSVWPSGHIEIIWSNPIEHLASWWPPGDTPQDLAKDLLNSKKGGGMPYIYEDLLPEYKGVLLIHWKTFYLSFCSNKDFSITGFKPRVNDFLDRRTFFPRSILFHLHLFCSETRNRS